jgi:hypothetical protein
MSFNSSHAPVGFKASKSQIQDGGGRHFEY